MTLRTIKLGGVLGKQFGKQYRLDVHSFRDAMAALCMMKPGFEKYLRTAEERGLVFAVFVDERNLGQEELELTGRTDGHIRIQPIVQGSKQERSSETGKPRSAAKTSPCGGQQRRPGQAETAERRLQ